jgi:hypothetical protein
MKIGNIQELFDLTTLHYAVYDKKTITHISIVVHNADGVSVGAYMLPINQTESAKFNTSILSLSQYFNYSIFGTYAKDGFLKFINDIMENKLGNDNKLFMMRFTFLSNSVEMHYFDRIVFFDSDFKKGLRVLKRQVKLKSKKTLTENIIESVSIHQSTVRNNGQSVYNIIINDFPTLVKKILHMSVTLYQHGDISDNIAGQLNFTCNELSDFMPIKFDHVNIFAVQYSLMIEFSTIENSNIQIYQTYTEPICIQTSIKKSQTFELKKIDNVLFNSGELKPLDRQILFTFSPINSTVDANFIVDYSKLVYLSGFRFIIRDYSNTDITNRFQILLNKKKDFDRFYMGIDLEKLYQSASDKEKPVTAQLNTILDQFTAYNSDLLALDYLSSVFKSKFTVENITFCKNAKLNLRDIFIYYWNILEAASPLYDISKSYAAVNNAWVEFSKFYTTNIMKFHTLTLNDFEVALLYNHEDIAKKYGTINIFIKYPELIYMDDFDRGVGIAKNSLYVLDSNGQKVTLGDSKFNQLKETVSVEKLLYEIPIN